MQGVAKTRHRLAFRLGLELTGRLGVRVQIKVIQVQDGGAKDRFQACDVLRYECSVLPVQHVALVSTLSPCRPCVWVPLVDTL